MSKFEKLKKKYPSKINESIDNSSNNIVTLKNKYNNINDILENNINIYSEKLEDINRELKLTKETRKEKEIFLKEFSNDIYKTNLDNFVLLRNKYLEKKNELEREKHVLNELNKNIENYLTDLLKTEDLIRKDSGFFL